METNSSPKTLNDFECLMCNYKCSKHSDFIKHESTRKHAKKLSGDKNIAVKEFICDICQKIYKSRNGLWKHSKQCAIDDFTKSETDKILFRHYTWLSFTDIAFNYRPHQNCCIM